MVVSLSFQNLFVILSVPGFNLAKQIFHPSFIAEYWVTLLVEYRNKMNYQVTKPAAGAVPLMTWALNKK
jgi:hypothetical protein